MKMPCVPTMNNTYFRAKRCKSKDSKGKEMVICYMTEWTQGSPTLCFPLQGVCAGGHGVWGSPHHQGSVPVALRNLGGPRAVRKTCRNGLHYLLLYSHHDIQCTWSQYSGSLIQPLKRSILKSNYFIHSTTKVRPNSQHIWPALIHVLLLGISITYINLE